MVHFVGFDKCGMTRIKYHSIYRIFLLPKNHLGSTYSSFCPSLCLPYNHWFFFFFTIYSFFLLQNVVYLALHGMQPFRLASFTLQYLFKFLHAFMWLHSSFLIHFTYFLKFVFGSLSEFIIIFWNNWRHLKNAVESIHMLFTELPWY